VCQEFESLLGRQKTGPLAQLVERSAHNRLAAGSSPAGPTKAVVVEWQTRYLEGVVIYDHASSSLADRTKRHLEGYRSGHNGAVLKTVRVQAHGGSNPSPSATKIHIKRSP
jgi:hypothetical protein